MDTTELTYPIFEANQVLTNAHLNDLFEYLDEQQRLTRANLIGIGIVCGLDVELAGPSTVRLTRGCGITSQGYLIVEPDDVDLTSVRPYQLPGDDPMTEPSGGSYPPFVQPGTEPPQQYDLWELFPDDDVPGAKPLATSGLVLDDKAVVLFLELRRNGLRNCSPNNCDDRGSQVTTAVRRLLVDLSDLDEIPAAAPAGLPALTDVDARLDLPDLQLLRFDVPNSAPSETEEILAGFQAPFRAPKLARQVGLALGALYATFRPLVVDGYPADPFAGFTNRFGFLDTAPVTTTQVRFLQYYWDLFADLLDAYDEARWAGVELLCACCPPEGVFPRHLVAGALAPAGPGGDRRRHHFVASPAVGDCVRHTHHFRVLFDRLVGMIASFTDEPALPPAAQAGPDRQIRVTPTRRGSVALGDRAIPYYYEHDVAEPLYRSWDPIKTERRRAHHNLGYRADEYLPEAPPFVADPLRFDLDPHDFLRIEGHLGKDVRDVVSTLITLRHQRRLPIEVVAVRAGAFDESIEVDLDDEVCRFEDLDTLYEALTSELRCFLAKQLRYFYELPSGTVIDEVAVNPSLDLLRDFAPDFVVQPGTLGRLIEANLTWRPGLPFVGFASTPESELTARERLIGRRDAMTIADALADAGAPDPGGDLTGAGPDAFFPAADIADIADFAAPVDPQPTDHPEVAFQVFALTNAMTELSALVPSSIGSLDVTAFADRYARLVAAAEQFDAARRAVGFDRPWLSDRIDDIVFRCRLDPFEALAEEYRRRLRDVKQARFFADYAEHHPGLQHGAGVPMGGTFVVVYHEPTAHRGRLPVGVDGFAGVDVADAAGAFAEPISTVAGFGSALRVGGGASPLDEALASIRLKPEIAVDPDVVELYRALTGTWLVPKVFGPNLPARIYAAAVSELSSGTVIADFFLPYQCCSDCSPIHFTLPPVRLRMSVDVGCTTDDGAEVVVTVDGATGQVSVAIDDGGFSPLTGPIQVPAGEHTIVARDVGGVETPTTPFVVPPALTTSEPDVTVNEAERTYQVAFEITGGTPPYTVDPGTVAQATYQSPVIAGGESLHATVRDAAGCTIEIDVEAPIAGCDLPCGGRAERRGYRFWAPEARPNLPLNDYTTTVEVFAIVDDSGARLDLAPQVQEILNSRSTPIRTAEFPEVVARWLGAIGEQIEAEVGSPDWFVFEYEPAAELPFGTLWIDRLSCLGLEVHLAFEYSQGEFRHVAETQYDRAGTLLRIDDFAARIPPFDGEVSDKCDGGEPEPICDGVDFGVEIVHEVIDGGVELFAEVVAGDPVVMLWDVPGAIPPMANGEHVRLQLSEGTTELMATLTVFDQRGCSLRFDRRIDVG